jgi:sec-independent protein translocase protein TatA
MIANLMGGDGLIVLVIALVVLVGGSQLPKIARNVGTAGKEFRKAQQEAEEDAEHDRQAKAAKEAAMTPVAIPPAPAPAPAVGPPGPSTAAAPAAPADPAITLTPAQLDALLKAREDQVRGESN